MGIIRSWDATRHPFRYLYLAGVADMADVLSNLKTELAANGWTEPVADTMQSPANAEGQYLTSAFALFGAGPPYSYLKATVYDHNGFFVGQRSLSISVLPATNVDLFTGPEYFYIHSSLATKENLEAYVIDGFPEDQKDILWPVVMAGYRNGAGSIDGAGTGPGWMFGIDNKQNNGEIRSMRGYTNMAGYSVSGVTPSGVILVEPVAVFLLNQQHRQFGYLPQVAWGQVAPNTDYTIPITEAATGVFRGVGQTSLYTKMLRKS